MVRRIMADLPKGSAPSLFVVDSSAARKSMGRNRPARHRKNSALMVQSDAAEGCVGAGRVASQRGDEPSCGASPDQADWLAGAPAPGSPLRESEQTAPSPSQRVVALAGLSSMVTCRRRISPSR